MKKSLITFIAFLVLLGSAYSSLWMYGCTLVERHVAKFIMDAREDGLIFQSGQPEVGGFPLQYNIQYSGDILMDHTGYVVHVPALSIRSFFFGDNNVEIELSKGIHTKNSDDPWINSVDYFYTNMIIPASFPADMTREGLQDWYNRGGTITFDEMVLQKEDSKISAQITLQLDKNLQPDVLVVGQIYKAEEFIDILTQRGYIEVKDQLFATTILAPLSRKDEQTGEKYTAISLRLRNQSVLVGPLQVGSFPLFRWPWRNLPDQHQ